MSRSTKNALLIIGSAAIGVTGSWFASVLFEETGTIGPWFPGLLLFVAVLAQLVLVLVRSREEAVGGDLLAATRNYAIGKEQLFEIAVVSARLRDAIESDDREGAVFWESFRLQYRSGEGDNS